MPETFETTVGDFAMAEGLTKLEANSFLNCLVKMGFAEVVRSENRNASGKGKPSKIFAVHTVAAIQFKR